MRIFLLILCLILFLFPCEARRRRKQTKNSSAHGITNPSQDRLPGFDVSTDDPSAESNSDVTSLLDTQISLPDISGNDHAKAKNVQNGQRKSKRNRKSKKPRKGKKRGNRRRLRAKELLRSTMRHMFGFEHMNVPRMSLASSFQLDASFAGISSTENVEGIRGKQRDDRHQENADHQRVFPNPPDFMLELYRTYSEDKSLMLINSKSQGNTIRSFFSVAGEAPDRLRNKGKPMIIIPYTNNGDETGHFNRQQIRVFAFNVTSIPSSESIVAAELRMDGLRNFAVEAHTQNHLGHNISRNGWSAVISVYRVADSQMPENATKNVYERVGRAATIRPSSPFAWVDTTIARLASQARNEEHILIVKFNHVEGDEQNRNRRSAEVPLDNFSDQTDQSFRSLNVGLPSYFVVMDTDRPKRNSGDNSNQHSYSPFSSAFPFTPILIVYCNDSKTVVSPAPAADTNGIWTTLGNLTAAKSLRRARRSPGQRLPDASRSSSSDEDDNEFPGESHRDNAGMRSTTHFPTIADNAQTELHDNGRSERRVIQSLKDRKSLAQSRKGKKRKRGRKCKKPGRKGKKPRKCRRKNPSAPEPSFNRAQQICSRKSLHVDFGDIGWADWIISPKNFDAYYCSGLCEFDTMKKTGPSNHAIIQAFIKAFEINPEVPAPCCVPDKLMSLSVLFFDKDDNVVLKVYPNMSVESCACR